MKSNATPLPEMGLLRLYQIIGRAAVTREQADANRQTTRRRRLRVRERSAIPALVPVSKSTWWAGVADGRYPQPVKIGKRAVAWRVEDIRALIEAAA